VIAIMDSMPLLALARSNRMEQVRVDVRFASPSPIESNRVELSWIEMSNAIRSDSYIHQTLQSLNESAHWYTFESKSIGDRPARTLNNGAGDGNTIKAPRWMEERTKADSGWMMQRLFVS